MTHYETTPDGIVATCEGCGASYTAEAWQRLPLVGHMDWQEDGDNRLEMRNCQCLPRRQYTRSAIIAEEET